jgi:uracil-DNA glycosylase family 4
MNRPFVEALDLVYQSLLSLRMTRGDGLAADAAALDRLLTVQPYRGELPAAETLPPPKAAPKRVEEFTATTPGGAEKAARMDAVRARALPCTLCPHLAASRTQVVFGVGSIDAELMFIGEAPGADEDLQGEPFVGKAGQLLTKIIETMGYRRSDVFIANVLKCRPDMPPGKTGNRKPTPEEMATCLPYLREQIEIVQPRVMVALGAVALEGLLGKTGSVTEMRGKWQDFHGTPLMPTYHPAYLLRNQALTEKRKVWEDMLLVLEKLGRPISEKQRQYFLPRES